MSHFSSHIVTKLSPVIKDYEWGKKLNQNGFVTQLIHNHPSLLNDIDSYAELWMGTHPSGMSTVSDSGEPLSEWIELNFLFKVLSIAKPLSIQVHPDKSMAQILHQTQPDLYIDDNHKPEMAIALCDGFESLVGFRPISEINQSQLFQSMMQQLIQIDSRLTKELGSMNDLIQLIESLLHLDQSSIEKIQQSIIDESNQSNDNDSILFNRLYKDYPNDVGCFFAALMNHFVLQKGEAIFIKPGQIHAYICGDIIECMACSDNVIRAGLTQKIKDVDTLCCILRQNQDESFDSIIIHPTIVNDCCWIYESKFTDEFKVARYVIDNDQWSSRTSSYCIILVINGSGTLKCTKDDNSTMINIEAGSIFCVKPGCNLELERSSETIEFWMAL